MLFVLACSVEEKDFIQPKPSAIEASEIGAISFKANWQLILTAQAYFVDVATDENFNAILPNYRGREVIENFLLIEDLEVGQTYYYRVRAKVNSVLSGFSNPVRVTTTVGSFGETVALLPQQITLESFLMLWRGSENARSYFIDVATDPDFLKILPNYNQLEVKETQITISGLQPNTTYFYRVRAKRGNFISANSNIISARTNNLERPNVFAADQVDLNGFRLHWQMLRTADEYILDVAQDINFQQILPDYRSLVVRDTFRLITNLKPRTNYFYRVRAKKGNFLSEFSNVISVQTNGLEIPTALPASLVQLSSFRANWRTVQNIDSYVLTVAIDEDFKTLLPDYSQVLVRDNFMIIRNLRPNTTYFYRLSVVRSGFASDLSNIVGITTSKIENPTTLPATDIDFTTFRAKWQQIPEADGYFLEVAEDFEFTKILTDYNNIEVRDTSRVIRNLEIGKSYFYRVRAKKDNLTSGYSNVSSVNTRSLNNVTALPATNADITKFTANWLSLDGVESYIIDVSDIGDFSKLIGGFNGLRIIGTSIEVTGLMAGKTYYYRVRGVRNNATTTNSNTIAITTKIFDAPVALTATNITFTGFQMNWKAVVGAMSYLLEVAKDINFTNFVAGYESKELVGITENITGLDPQKTYYYRLRAKGLGVISGYSNTISAVTNSLSTPKALDATNITLNSFRANWELVTGATSYSLEVATNITFTSLVAGYPKEIIGSSDIVTGLNSQTTYYYRVSAKISSGAKSPASHIIPVITDALIVPVATNATNITLTSFTANWNSVSTANSYLITIALDAAFTTVLAGYNDLEIGTTSLAVAGLTPNTTYYYRVKSKNGTAISVVSNVITLLTAAINAPVATAATNFLANGFQANWQAVTNATSYFLDVATDAGFTMLVAGYNAKEIIGLDENVVGLTPNTTYYYRIKASGLGSFSAYSNIIASVTALIAPNALPATLISSARFTARWDALPGATSYFLDVSSSFLFNSFIPGYNNLEVFATTQLVNVPDMRIPYYYRVRAKNSTNAVSASSAPITVNNGVNSGTNICRLSSFQLFPNVMTTSVQFTYPTTTSTLPSRIANTELDIRFDITYSGNQITQALLRKNSSGNPLFQTWLFAYDASNNVSQITIRNASSVFVELWRFTYDADSKITNWARYADMLGLMLIEDRKYNYAPGQLSPNETLNLTTVTDEFDLVYDTWASPLFLLSKDLAMMVNYTTATKPTPATPDPVFASVFPFLPTRNIVTETFNPTMTTNNYTYTRSTTSKSVATTRRLGTVTASYSFSNCAL